MNKKTIVVLISALATIVALSIALMSEKKQTLKVEKALQEEIATKFIKEEDNNTRKQEPPQTTESSIKEKEVVAEKEAPKEQNLEPVVENVPKTLLETFMKNYVNDSSIQERNKELVKYTTKKAIEELGLAQPVEIPISSSGSVQGIYQTIEKNSENRYLVHVTQETMNTQMDYVAELTITQEDSLDKVDSVVYHLYKNAC